MIDLSGQMLMAHIVAFTSAQRVRIPVVMTTPIVVANVTPSITPDVEQLTTAVTGFSIHDHLPSPSPVKRNWVIARISLLKRVKKSAISSVILASTNQQDSITSQLNNGVRGLMLDLYDFENDVWLCQSFGGQCFNYTTFQPVINVLKEIQAFLEANPSEIVTIIIKDYVTSPKGLIKVFNVVGLRKYWFPVS
ncbi:hypothetical protein KIW84_062419 [Lathyrus oleraceus]|uniref:Uncharacterized protein n=1 Tax=Pisum sativum TaxID=3888 RepID=A0A9D4W8D2_PEA|nr:hypothetical protein KIW84_062419 [Pisum sativum]